MIRSLVGTTKQDKKSVTEKQKISILRQIVSQGPSLSLTNESLSLFSFLGHPLFSGFELSIQTFCYVIMVL